MMLTLACGWGLLLSHGAPDPETPDPSGNQEGWTDLLEKLRSNRPLRADFVETRVLPFRRESIVLSGTLRLDDDGGLSLHYPEATGSPVTVIDAEGMATRTGDDPWRPLPDRRSVQMVHGAIASLLTLDFERLDADFDLERFLEGADWSVQLTPEPNADTGRLKTLSIRGTRDRVTQLRVGLGGDRGILIEISNEERVPCFEAAERNRFFR
jgi:hypothetical protein